MNPTTIQRMPYSHAEIHAAAALHAEAPLLPLPPECPPAELMEIYREKRAAGWSRKAAATFANSEWRM